MSIKFPFSPYKQLKKKIFVRKSFDEKYVQLFRTENERLRSKKKIIYNLIKGQTNVLQIKSSYTNIFFIQLIFFRMLFFFCC